MRRINNLLYHVHVDGSVLFFFFSKMLKKIEIETELVNTGKKETNVKREKMGWNKQREALM